MNTQRNRHRTLRAGLAGLCTLALAGVALLCGPPAARAQDAGGAGKPVTISLQNAPVQTVLRSLFKSAGKNFTIDPGVAGTVTVDVTGVPFDTALQAVLSGTNPPPWPPRSRTASTTSRSTGPAARRPGRRRQHRRPTAAARPRRTRTRTTPTGSRSRTTTRRTCRT